MAADKLEDNLRARLRGKALTVLGPTNPDDLGLVLPHEHIFMDFNNNKQPLPPTVRNRNILTALKLDNIGEVRQYPYCFALNMALNDIEDAADELMLFKQSGGGCVCELSVRGLRLDSNTTEQLRQLSQSTGVHIVCGTGYYVDAFMTDEERLMSVDELSRVMVDEIITGIPDTNGVRCGIIGEIGCSWPLTVNERKVLQGAAQAQQHTGAPLIIHPGRESSAPFEIIDILRDAGADLSRTVMSHLERTLFDPADFIRFAETGCISELDLFGTECSHYQFNPQIDMPSDAQRIAIVKMLCDKGYADRVFISHDIHTKHRLVKYGGHGYRHIPINIVPKMRDRGISDTDIEKITITNPKQWLTFH